MFMYICLCAWVAGCVCVRACAFACACVRKCVYVCVLVFVYLFCRFVDARGELAIYVMWDDPFDLDEWFPKLRFANYLRYGINISSCNVENLLKNQA